MIEDGVNLRHCALPWYLSCGKLRFVVAHLICSPLNFHAKTVSEIFMSEKLNPEKVHSFTRAALPLMSQHGIPTTPMNYSIWFSYVSGENKDLNTIIDHMLENGEAFTPEKSKELYSKFCTVYDETKVKTLQDGLTQLMVTLFGEIRGISGQTENYEMFLSRSLSQLTEDEYEGDITDLIQDILNETKSVVQKSKTMQEKLKETSRTLMSLQKEYELAKKEAYHDPLTSVFNRKGFQEKADFVMSKSMESGYPLSMLMADIDHFKTFNDTHGHLAGDEVLKFVARTMKNMVKGQDVVARFGGEEFVILLPKTGFEGALHVAEQIRGYFNKNALKSEIDLGKITISMGLSVYKKGETLDSFVERADQALYKAKKAGRNRVLTERHLENMA